MDERHTDELHQIANLVIDAYLGRDNSFKPVFADWEDAILYLTPPKTNDASDANVNLKTPKLNFWYQRSDY